MAFAKRKRHKLPTSKEDKRTTHEGISEQAKGRRWKRAWLGGVNSGWASTKAAYDILPNEQTPILRPRRKLSEGEIQTAEVQCSKCWTMEYWMLGAPVNLARTNAATCAPLVASAMLQTNSVPWHVSSPRPAMLTLSEEVDDIKCVCLAGDEKQAHDSERDFALRSVPSATPSPLGKRINNR
ncbi:unnamed protein product [Penicillium camemberti]|uniref:Str. FM013 n=1 Tax=Penicillium camemberti (strain FM 013) TaxID=1429867 RepID=A0A0G4PWC6_PENC3|nr:unnamed protein product [Penicillium camemberti]